MSFSKGENLRRRPSAGLRPHAVTIKSATNVKNTTSGEFTQTYAALDPVNPTRYASIEPLSGRELQIAREVQADVSHRVGIPWDPKMSTANPKCIIVFGTRTFQILSAINIEERDHTLEFMCVEQISPAFASA